MNLATICISRGLLLNAFSGLLKFALETLVYAVDPEVLMRPTSPIDPGMNWAWLKRL